MKKLVQAKHVSTLDLLLQVRKKRADPRQAVLLSQLEAPVPEKVLLAKLRGLVRSGLLDGCSCGCSGNFRITSKGLAFIAQHEK